jgi:hypothetical protein
VVTQALLEWSIALSAALGKSLRRVEVQRVKVVVLANMD